RRRGSRSSLGPETGRCTHPLPAKDALDRIPVFLGDGRGWRHLRDGFSLGRRLSPCRAGLRRICPPGPRLRPGRRPWRSPSPRPGGLALASRLEVGRPSFQEAAMTLSDVGREAVRLVSQLTGVAISVPVVAGFVLLGAAVLVGGSLLDVGRKLLETKPRAREPLKAA